MARRPLILLPPSAGKAPGGAGPGWQDAAHRFAHLHPLRRRVRDAVRSQVAAGADAARLFGVSARALPEVLAEWADLDTAPTLPAAQRYDGVVWTALAPGAMAPGVRRRFAARVLVVSGLWGLLAVTDGIPPYRLPMDVSLDGVGRLGAFWRPHVSAAVDAAAGGGWVFDLLPDEHAAALADDLPRRCRVEIVTDVAGARRAIGHAGKAVKGRLARAMLEADVRSPAALARLEVPGLAAVVGTPGRVVFAVRD